MHNPKFTIITPTLLRDSLIKTCKSIENQKYKNWEHIVVVDLPKEKVSNWRIQSIAHPQRKIILLQNNCNDFGNTPRLIAYNYVTGDLVMYLDDDDYYIHKNEPFQTLVNYFNNHFKDKPLPNLGIFPARRLEQRFFNFPPQVNRTMSCQYFHKPVIKGLPIQWRVVDRKSYVSDWQFLHSVLRKTVPTKIAIEKELVCVNKISRGSNV